MTDAQEVPVTVDVDTEDGTGDGDDYVGLSTTVTFEPGELTRTVTVRVIGDTVFEPDETFFVVLSNPSSGVSTKDRGVDTIRNDDPAPN